MKFDKFYVILCLIAGVILFFYGQIDYSREPFSKVDLKYYRTMAETAPGLWQNGLRPFAYRIAGPYLAGLLPFPIPFNFYFLTLAGTFALLSLLYHFVLTTGIRASIAALTVTLFILNKYFIGFVVWDFFQLNDVLSMIQLVLLWQALQARRWRRYAIVFMLGALTREPFLLMLPTTATYLMEKKAPVSDWAGFLTAILPGLLIFGGLRIFLPAGGDHLHQALLICAPKLLSLTVGYRLFINAFAPLTFLPLIFLPTTLAFLKGNRHRLVFVAAAYFSALFGFDNERLIMPAAIVFYPLIAQIIQTHFWVNRLPLAVIVAACAIASRHHDMAHYPLPDRQTTVILTLIALIIATGTAVYCRLNSNPGKPE